MRESLYAAVVSDSLNSGAQIYQTIASSMATALFPCLKELEIRLVISHTVKKLCFPNPVALNPRAKTLE